MTRPCSVNALSGTRQLVRYAFTSPSRSTCPDSTSRRAARAATGLEIEAAWKSVFGVTGRPDSTSASPYPRAQAISPSTRTATLTPGTPSSAMRSASEDRATGSPRIVNAGISDDSTSASGDPSATPPGTELSGVEGGAHASAKASADEVQATRAIRAAFTIPSRTCSRTSCGRSRDRRGGGRSARWPPPSPRARSGRWLQHRTPGPR